MSGSGFVDAMGTDAMGALGLNEGVFETEDPSFTVQVGNDKPYTVTIAPGDTIADLEAKLSYNPATQTGIPGLFVDIDAVDGTLSLRPGIDDSNWGPLDTAPLYGGDITITSSGFETSLGANGNPALDDNINVVSALFGSYNATTLDNLSPLTDVTYVSEITNGSGTFTNFRNRFLGPNAAISTGISSASNLLDYSQKIIDETSQDYIQAQSAFENEDTLRGILEREFSDESGVNIDEEMSNLIVVQTAYAAAARTITAADEMFQELINSIRR
jgi:flagellar hook-associated protein 1 FlgK